MRPGKRPGNDRKRRPEPSDPSRPPPTWSLHPTHTLQRCIVTHDLAHILNWHTPAYTAAVAGSLIIVLLGAATFSGWASYVALCAAAAIIVGGVGSSLEVESGPSAVLSPAEPTATARTGVRSKPTVESNLRTIYARVVEPLLEEATAVLFPKERSEAFGMRWLGVLGAVTVIAELAKLLPCAAVLAIIVFVTFAATGVRALRA